MRYQERTLWRFAPLQVLEGHLDYLLLLADSPQAKLARRAESLGITLDEEIPFIRSLILERQMGICQEPR